MSDLRFDNGNNEFGKPPASGGGFDLAAKLVQWGVVSNKQQGTYVLIGLVVLMIAVAIFVYSSGSGAEGPPMLP